MASYNEPKYDTDQVNYGFLKKTFSLAKEENNQEIKQYSKNFSSPPNPPYYEGWTYTQNNKIYRCIKNRLLGSFSITDWVIIYDQKQENMISKNFLFLSEVELKEQSDGKIETFYQNEDPSLSWDTAIEKSNHEGDYWRTNENGIYKNYVYVKYATNPISYNWELIDVPISVFNTIEGNKTIYTNKPSSYKQGDYWKIKEEDLEIFPNLNLNIGDYVESISNSDFFNPKDWRKKDDELSLKFIETYYYTTSEINKMVEVINKNIAAEIIKGENSIKAFVKEEYTTKKTSEKLTEKINANGETIEQIIGENTTETPTLNLAQLSILANEVNLEVAKKVNNSDYTAANIFAKINEDESVAGINANKIILTANDILNLIAGNELNFTSKNISLKADNCSIDKDGNAFFNNAILKNITIEGGNIVLEDSQSASAIKIISAANDNIFTQYNSSGMRLSKNGIQTVLISNNPWDDGGFISVGTNSSDEITTITKNGISTPMITAGGNRCVTSPYVNWLNFVNTDSSNYMEVNLYNPFAGVSAFGINVWASDKRLKKNIIDSKYNALEIIKQIKHREFDYKKSGHVKLGYIADELEELDNDLIFEVGEDKIKQPSVDKLIPLLSKAIQEQQVILEEKERKIQEQRELSKKLEERIQRLENVINIKNNLEGGVE